MQLDLSAAQMTAIATFWMTCAIAGFLTFTYLSGTRVLPGLGMTVLIAVATFGAFLIVLRVLGTLNTPP